MKREKERSTDPTIAETAQLIPGLPDEVAELCLLRLPFPTIAAARAVSAAWKRLLSDPTFHSARASLSLAKPYLFVSAIRRPSSPPFWLAFDPRARRWLPPLPTSPLPPSSPSSSAEFGGAIFVVDGEKRSLTIYDPRINRWTIRAPMPTARSAVAVGAVGGRIMAVGGGRAAEAYDPDRDVWMTAEEGGGGVEEVYDAAVVGDRMYVTEGWQWPFDRAPRGEVYGGDGGRVMAEGWTGGSAVVAGRVVVVEEWGEGRVKVYEGEGDRWRGAEGGGVPRRLGKPAAVGGGEGELYVVGEGMRVVVGELSEEVGGKQWRVRWEEVEGPAGLGEVCPCRCHVICA